MRRARSLSRHPVDPAAEVVAEALPLLRLGARPLVVDEPSGLVAGALSGQGADPQSWLRRAAGAQPASVWPQAGPCTSALVRLPKAKDALDFALHAAASVVPFGAEIVVFGANDEGIRSADKQLAVVAEAVATVDRRRHCRVLCGTRRHVIANHRPFLSNWRREMRITLAGGTRNWVSYPGLFAGGFLDEGTALLLDHLPPLASKARVLDFGCGTGLIGAAVLQHQPDAAVDLLDADALAVEAARENVPGAGLILAPGLDELRPARYDAILSNPPIHEGVVEHHGALRTLIAEAPKFLRANGVLQVVVQRRIGAAALLDAAFGNAAVVAETGRFRVLRATRLQ